MAIETDAPGAGERRKISSQTFTMKFVIPVFMVAFGAIFIVLSRLDEANGIDPSDGWILATAWLAMIAFFYFLWAPLKEVWLGPGYLYISNFSRTISVPYSEIEKVSENRWVNPRSVTITFRGETAFGRSIRFLPTRRYFAFWSRHPIVAELRGLARGIESIQDASPEPNKVVARVPGIHRFRSTLAWLNNLPPKKLIYINLGFSFLTVLSNSLALTSFENIPGLSEQLRHTIIYVVLPVAACVVATSLIGLMCERCREHVLAVHGCLIGFGALLLVFWAGSIAIDGLPRGASFSWSPGFMEAMVAYSCFLFCRFTLPKRLRAGQNIFYLPLIAGLLVIPLDLALMIRLLELMASMMGRSTDF